MNVSEPSFFSMILSFLFNLLLSLLVAILSFFGIASSSITGGEDATVADSTAIAVSPTPAAISQESGNLVNAAWLSTHLNDDNLRVVAVSTTDEFESQHIPGATQIDYPALEIDDTSAAGMSAWEDQISSSFTSLGITTDSTVVVYDYGTHYSPRLWWVLKLFGVENTYLLDGGYQSWSDSVLPSQSGSPVAPPPTIPFLGFPDTSMIADKEAVKAAIDSGDTVLVDARTPEEYAAGHIPGAVNIPFTDNFAADGALLDLDALTTLYVLAGVTPNQSVIVYCSTGVRASSDFLALTELAYPDVRLYLGSYQEWSADPSLPVEK
jgi:thiosulfate/3-mercaptopyruvate sulfurtransferase